ncbi:DTW domain-containing protein [Chytridium lagenaria]|nr:DTW domain-containing protein [Chytridium lagenaria]
MSTKRMIEAEDNGEIRHQELSELNISDSSHLLDAERVLCSVCRRSQMVYCPNCCIPLGHQAPNVSLPIPLDIYRHPREVIGKTTSVHAKLVSPGHVNIFVDDFKRDSLEELTKRYPDPSRVLLLFPTPDSVPVTEIDISAYDRLVVLDGTWKHARSMSAALEHFNFKKVRISLRRTLFWRYQKWATIRGKYDDLLFYFKQQYDKIQHHYRKNPEISFTRKKLDATSYIQYMQMTINNKQM